jgi:hypothetical protein
MDLKRFGALVSLVEHYGKDVIVNCKTKMRLQTLEMIEAKVETDSINGF